MSEVDVNDILAVRYQREALQRLDAIDNPIPLPPKRIRKRRTSETPLDVEAKAIGETYTALKPLGEDLAALDRVIDYVRRRFGFPG